MRVKQQLKKWEAKFAEAEALEARAYAGALKVGGSYSFYRQAALEADAARAKVALYKARVQSLYTAEGALRSKQATV